MRGFVSPIKDGVEPERDALQPLHRRPVIGPGPHLLERICCGLEDEVITVARADDLQIDRF